MRKPSPRNRWTGSPRSAAASRCSTGWRTGRILRRALRRASRGGHAACGEDARQGTRSRPAPTRPAWRRTTRGVARMARHRQDGRRPADVPAAQPARSGDGTAHVDRVRDVVLERGGQERAHRGGAAGRPGGPGSRFLRAEDDIAGTTALLTVVDGKIVWARGRSSHDAPIPPAMPDWSPVREFGGYGGWGDAARRRATATGGRRCDVRLRERMQRSPACACERMGKCATDVRRKGLLGRVRVLCWAV